jgi:DNA-binding GntR family transcriptional regulator
VTTKQSRSTIEAAAAQFRAMSLDAEEGALLGSEDTLVQALGVSRATVRQVARLLEREGLLKVRRGINGGYFAARPDVDTIEQAVSAYLVTLDMDAQDVTTIASVLWVEVLRKAAGRRSAAAREMVEAFRARVAAVRPDAPFSEIVQLEQDSRTAIFDLIKARYIELIFQINVAFAQKRFAAAPEMDPGEHRAFVHAWRNAKLMELEAIADGDPELGMMAARHIRTLWHQRIWRDAHT